MRLFGRDPEAVRRHLTRFLPPPRVLLAEDDREMQRMLAQALRKVGCEVVEVPDGVQLVEYLTACIRYGSFFRVPDLIVSDVRMPGPSGVDVLAGLRAAQWTTPMIMITAFGDHEIHSRAQRLGATAVFDKPFDVDELRDAVLSATPGQRRRAPNDAALEAARPAGDERDDG
jgi:CheY-like chemotaxis protein